MKKFTNTIKLTIALLIGFSINSKAQDAFTNGGFETGTFSSWTVLGSSPAPAVSTAAAHSGTNSAALGSFGGGETPGDASIYQTINVPAAGGTLSYWYLSTTSDGIAFDWQDAYVVNTSGTILATIMHVCSNSGAWTNVTYNMAAYAGQTVRIEFLVHGDNAGDPTNMYVDDVSLPISSNDGCANAIMITNPSTTTGNTSGFTSDVTPCATFSSPGMWYSVTGDGQQFTASLCGSSYDTWISIYSGTCGALSCISFNDDFCSLQSQTCRSGRS